MFREMLPLVHSIIDRHLRENPDISPPEGWDIIVDLNTRIAATLPSSE
jgi:hypothetical protein